MNKEIKKESIYNIDKGNDFLYGGKKEKKRLYITTSMIWAIAIEMTIFWVLTLNKMLTSETASLMDLVYVASAPPIIIQLIGLGLWALDKIKKIKAEIEKIEKEQIDFERNKKRYNWLSNLQIGSEVGLGSRNIYYCGDNPIIKKVERITRAGNLVVDGKIFYRNNGLEISSLPKSERHYIYECTTAGELAGAIAFAEHNE